MTIDTNGDISSDIEGNIARLTLGGRAITLIGTAHVSRESIDEAVSIIKNERPDLLCVELDNARFKSMNEKDDWERLNIAKVFREGRGFLLLANLVLAGFQRRMGSSLGVKPGEEMLSAAAAAEELGIRCELCDREVQTTFRRAWAACGLWSKCKLLASLLSSAFSTEKLTSEEIENLKEASELDGMMAELAEYLPAVKKTLIDERDQYLAAKIWLAGQSCAVSAPSGDEAAGDNSRTAVVAVVGAGHLPGLVRHIKAIASGGESADVGALDQIPPPSAFSKVAGWIIPAIIIALAAAGFLRGGADVSLHLILRWILWNGSLAALGTILALGHPLSILVSFLGAPIATLNPFIGVGIFSGLVEAWVRKPRVQDAETLAEAFGSVRGVYQNRIARALLVFFLSSLGGALGNFISIPALAGQLFK